MLNHVQCFAAAHWLQPRAGHRFLSGVAARRTYSHLGHPILLDHFGMESAA